jgi:hypothetical protein
LSQQPDCLPWWFAECALIFLWQRTKSFVKQGRKVAVWSDHKRIEERSLQLHKEIARRLQKDPKLLQIAKDNLIRWIDRNGETPVWREWSEILNGPLSKGLSVLLSPDEKGARLSQSLQRHS